MLNGLLLVVGVISAAVGWIFIYPASPTDPVAQQAKDIMSNSGAAQAGMMLGFGGMFLAFIGLINLARSTGSAIGNIAAIGFMALLTFTTLGFGYEWAVSETNNAAAATSLMTVSLAWNNSLMFFGGISFTLLGLALLFGSNINRIGAVIPVVIGVLFLVALLVGGAVEDTAWMVFFVGILIVGITATLQDESVV